jgi:hypothetical protein
MLEVNEGALKLRLERMMSVDMGVTCLLGKPPDACTATHHVSGAFICKYLDMLKFRYDLKVTDIKDRTSSLSWAWISYRKRFPMTAQDRRYLLAYVVCLVHLLLRLCKAYK